MMLFKNQTFFFSFRSFIFSKTTVKSVLLNLQFQTFLGLHDFLDHPFRLVFLAG